MPVLLMTRGDAPSRDLLRRAIDARYGFQPPTLETLKLTLKGRVRVSRGIYKGWAPITVSYSARFPFQSRAEFAAQLLMVKVAHHTTVFDGTTVFDSSQPQTTERDAESARRQSWAFNALMLTPLNDMGVELKSTGPQSFEAAHKASGATALVTMDDANRVTKVTTTAYNWDTDSEQTFSLQPSLEQADFGSLLVPQSLTLAWDGLSTLEAEATGAELNPALPDSIFSLAK